MKTRTVSVVVTARTADGEEVEYRTTLLRIGDNTPAGHDRLTVPLRPQEADRVLRGVIAKGETPLTINGQPAYDPDELRRALSILKGAVERVSFCEFRMSTSLAPMSPGEIIELAEKEGMDVPL